MSEVAEPRFACHGCASTFATAHEAIAHGATGYQHVTYLIEEV